VAGRDGIVGLIAGAGTFPELLAGAVKSAGRTLVCLQVAGESAALATIADHYRRCPSGALREVLETLSVHAVHDVLVAGQFPRVDLLAQGDAVRDTLMRVAPDRRDASLLEGLASLLASQGMVLIRKKSAIWPGPSPRSLRTIVIVWFGRYHMPWAK